jgi:alkylated DNA nucleotide flippase Atl1
MITVRPGVAVRAPWHDCRPESVGTAVGMTVTSPAARQVAALAAVTGAGALVVGRIAAARRTREDLSRWRVVTVQRDPGDVGTDGSVPGPLAELRGVEVKVDAAPGDRGTELRARYSPKAKPGDRAEAVRRLRSALREAKQVLEAGEVLRPDGPSTTRRTATNAALRWATRNGRGEGRL